MPRSALFPGTYTFTNHSTWISYGSDNKMTISDPTDYPALRFQPTLTAAGMEATVDAPRRRSRRAWVSTS